MLTEIFGEILPCGEEKQREKTSAEKNVCARVAVNGDTSSCFTCMTFDLSVGTYTCGVDGSDESAAIRCRKAKLTESRTHGVCVNQCYISVTSDPCVFTAC